MQDLGDKKIVICGNECFPQIPQNCADARTDYPLSPRPFRSGVHSTLNFENNSGFPKSRDSFKIRS